MNRKGLTALLLALLLVIVPGCTTYLPGSTVSGSDAELLITDTDLTSELSNYYSEFYDSNDAVSFYYDGYTFVGTTLCNVIRCEDGSTGRSIAVMSDFPYYTYAMENGVEPITLGRRILRTETAGFMLLSVLMFRLEK